MSTESLAVRDSATSFNRERPEPSMQSKYWNTIEINYLRDLILYKLTVEAQRRIADSPLSKREIIRRLGTSATQLYRLLDQTNYKKSRDQLVSLLQLLECDVDLVVRAKSA